MDKLIETLLRVKWELYTNKELLSKPEIQQPMLKIITGLLMLFENGGK